MTKTTRKPYRPHTPAAAPVRKATFIQRLPNYGDDVAHYTLSHSYFGHMNVATMVEAQKTVAIYPVDQQGQMGDTPLGTVRNASDGISAIQQMGYEVHGTRAQRTRQAFTAGLN